MMQIGAMGFVPASQEIGNSKSGEIVKDLEVF